MLKLKKAKEERSQQTISLNDENMDFMTVDVNEYLAEKNGSFDEYLHSHDWK